MLQRNQSKNGIKKSFWMSTVEPRFNDGPRDWPNKFTKTRFHYIEVLFHTFYYNWGRTYSSLYQGLR